MANLIFKHILKPGGPSMRDMHTFRAIFDTTPSPEEIAQVQIDLGYHPAGYGRTQPAFSEPTLKEAFANAPERIPQGMDPETKVVSVIWQCWGSCD